MKKYIDNMIGWTTTGFGFTMGVIIACKLFIKKEDNNETEESE